MKTLSLFADIVNIPLYIRKNHGTIVHVISRRCGGMADAPDLESGVL